MTAVLPPWATAAAHVRSGMPAAEPLASVLSSPVQPAGQNRERPPSLPMAIPPKRDADPAGQFEGLRRPPGADLASQAEALRKQGSHVEVIAPDADSRAAMGTNQMDPATRIPAARAGFAQGKQEATRVTFL
jgi:hypothetical protein